MAGHGFSEPSRLLILADRIQAIRFSLFGVKVIHQIYILIQILEARVAMSQLAGPWLLLGAHIPDLPLNLISLLLQVRCRAVVNGQLHFVGRWPQLAVNERMFHVDLIDVASQILELVLVQALPDGDRLSGLRTRLLR